MNSGVIWVFPSYLRRDSKPFSYISYTRRLWHWFPFALGKNGAIVLSCRNLGESDCEYYQRAVWDILPKQDRKNVNINIAQCQ